MNYFKKLGTENLLMLLLCAVIILVAEYLFLTGDRDHGLFVRIINNKTTTPNIIPIAKGP